MLVQWLVQEIEAQVYEQVLSMAGGDIINLFLDLLGSFLNGITGVNLIKYTRYQPVPSPQKKAPMCMAVLEYSKELQIQTAAGAERESMLWSLYKSTKRSINTNITAICMTVTRRSSSFLRDDRYRHLINNLLPHSSMSTFPFLYLFN